MASDRDRKVRERAHQIWEESGRPDGKAEEHWAQAIAEIDGKGKTTSKKPAADSPKATGSSAKSKSKAAAEPKPETSKKSEPGKKAAAAPAKDKAAAGKASASSAAPAKGRKKA